MSESTKDLARRWFEEVWNQRCDEAIEELAAGDVTSHVQSETYLHGTSAFKEFRDNMVSAMPDLTFKIEDILAEGNQVVIRWLCAGTHTGNGFGFEPTNESIKFRGISWFRFRHGKLHEGWDSWNQGRVFRVMTNGDRD